MVPELIHERAIACPTALAIAGPDQELTYGELDGWAAAICGDLRAGGAARTGREDVVGLLLPRSPRLAAGALGALYAGCAYLPLDPEHPVDRIAGTLRDASCAAVLTTPELAARVPAGPWSVTVLGPTSPAGGCVPVGCLPPDRVAYVIYTSGSTGRPKGVQVTHGNLLNLCRWHADAFALTRRDRAALFSSPAFDAAVWELWPHLAAGASVHVPDDATRSDPSRLRDWLLATGVTVCFLPTALAELAATLEWPAGGPLRVLLTGADTLHRRPPHGLPFRFVNNYGPTECAVVATSGEVTPEDVDGRRPSIGGPIGGVTVRILDRDLAPVPPGAAGELCIGGAGVARGYLGRPALTAERYVPDPGGRGARLYRSGDRVALRADGELDFLGRTDDQVKIRGFRVEPDEIAAVLARHPDVLRAAVTTWEPVANDLRLAAYVVPAAGRQPAPAALRAHLEAELPAHMVPAAFVPMVALPLTASGKVDRAALPPPDRQAPRAGGAAEPGSPFEERVAALVAELLGLEAVGLDEDFFLLGGHSLLGAQLITRVRDAYSVELTLQGLFDNPTIGAIATEIEQLVVERIESLSDDEVEQLLA